MIEIELKYELKNSFCFELEPMKENLVEDIYYDTQDYQLLRSGNFLRVRNGKQIDFKLNANDSSHLYCKETNFSYKNENFDEIKKMLSNLGISLSSNNLEEIFMNLKVLAPIKKKRYTYVLEENVIMVLDKVENLGTFLEIEYDYDGDTFTKEQKDYFKKYLEEILNKFHLLKDGDREVFVGYVELYLKKYNVEAYQLGLYQE